jgi:hypothetical protein
MIVLPSSGPVNLANAATIKRRSLSSVGDRHGRVVVGNNLRQQQAASLAYFDVFWVSAVLGVLLVFLVLLMKRSVAEKGAALYIGKPNRASDGRMFPEPSSHESESLFQCSLQNAQLL